MNEIVSNRFRWGVIVTMFLVTATTALFMVVPAYLMGALMKTAGGPSGLSPRQVVFMTTGIFQIVYPAAMILGGPFLDRFGAFNVYIGSLILMCICALLMPLAGHSFPGMISLRTLQALGAGSIMVAAVPIAAVYFPANLRTAIIVLNGLAVAFGSFVAIGGGGGRILQSTGDPLTALAWLAPVTLPGLVLSIIAALRSKRPGKKAPGKKPFCMEDIGRVFMRPLTWTVIGCFAMASWVYQSANRVFLEYFISNPPGSPGGPGHDLPGGQALLTVFGIAMVFGAIASVLITEKPLKGNARPVVAAGFVIPAISIYLVKFPAPDAAHILLGLLLFAAGFFLAFVHPQVLGVIAKHYPVNVTGTIGGLTMGIGGFMGMAGTKVCLGVQRISGYPSTFSVMAGFAVLGVIFALFLKIKDELPLKK